MNDVKRITIFDDIKQPLEKNMFCNRKDLSNEASVEMFFVNRLLKDIGYNDNNIKTKQSIAKFKVSLGSKKVSYAPDYIITFRNIPCLVMDAKSTKENIFDFEGQCLHYSILLNRKEKSRIKYFILSNGLKTALYELDKEKPVLELDFDDFILGNTKYKTFKEILQLKNLMQEQPSPKKEELFELRKIDKEEAQKLFNRCHNYIRDAEKNSPEASFMEYVKIVFLKLWNDRILHDKYVENTDILLVPENEVVFSVKWIEDLEKDTRSPLNDLKYKELLERIQEEIDKNNKKRIFDENDKIDLKPETIKGVVKKMEHFYLYGIDEDLNGRLFETFLNATMRGKALGQFFTPRSIVLLATKLADLKANNEHIDRVLDASCGTGGFLIEALSDMRNKIRDSSYSKEKKKELIDKISNEFIFGIDAAKKPNLCRIARINMYLHGDGGSHIYFSDSLDKQIKIDKDEQRETQKEIIDLKKQLQENPTFDVILTNPPFSLWYKKENQNQMNIIEQYELLKYLEGSEKQRERLPASAMFIERYKDLLEKEGKLFTIIDETILSSQIFDYVRNFIRKYFVVKAVISLHGDAFRMSGSRVKTSILFLEKKKNPNQEQPPVFMYASTKLGVDDMPVTTSKVKILEAREQAKIEIEKILKEFNRFERGESDSWLVSPDRIKDRLDVKYCIGLQGRFINKWKKSGYEIKNLYQVAEEKVNEIELKEHPDKEFKILVIGYNGLCKIGEIRKGKNIKYKKMKVVETGDLVISEYNSVHGAIGFITEEFNGALASASYTVLKCKNDVDALYLWSILRTTEIRCDLLTSSVGMGRQTVAWSDIKNVKIPFLSESERKKLYDKIIDAWKKEKEAKEDLLNVKAILNEKFNVESEESKERFEETKPPR